MSLNTRVEYGEAADLEEDRSTAQTVSRSRQFYAPVVPDVSSRGRLHNIEPSELNQTKIKSRSKTKNMLNFRALHASFCWQSLWRCWFHFPAGLGTCPHCQRYQKLVQWPWCYCAWLSSKLAWPEPHRESMRYCQEEDERHRPNNADDLKAAIKATWVSITPEQCHKLITSTPRRIDAVIHAKGGPTKYWVHRNALM